jgi:hypothetical protein
MRHLLRHTGFTEDPRSNTLVRATYETLCGAPQTLADIPADDADRIPPSQICMECHLWHPGGYIVGIDGDLMICICPAWIGAAWSDAFGGNPTKPLTRFDAGVLADWLEQHADPRCEHVRAYAETISDDASASQSHPVDRRPSLPGS